MSADSLRTQPGTPGDRTAVLTDLTDSATACADGRRFVADHLSRCDVPTQTIDEVTLLTSELITNAIRHAPPPLCLQISVTGDVVRVQVHDSDPAAPVLTRPDFNSVGGRGMWLIDTMATRWGFYEQQPGKEVWFEIAFTPAGEVRPAR